MITEATARALAGAWRIFLGDRAALSAFDVSAEGFWRSFGAVLFTAPTYLLIILFEERMRIAADPLLVVGAPFYAARGAGFLIDIAFMPVLLALAARPLKIEAGYSAYIVVRNWGGVLILLPMAGLMVLTGWGILPLGLSTLLQLGVLIMALRFQVELARTALGWPLGPALGLAGIEYLSSLFVVLVTDRLFGV
ncbi:hypothetical protein [Prosthecomicrobium pneumaticum]|uniref:Uncharacterized protein n=1 Tax=Prosthecomicrobium pneumaticum TaxID=81895 RepID=A0A7W9L223_9HYPH|nr:hypothetical protein [Prosthecomicrobium pneumaticum]MBB5753157.1 hypothetical protein [Prosthecomicrobium pneumaticum]